MIAKKIVTVNIRNDEIATTQALASCCTPELNDGIPTGAGNLWHKNGECIMTRGKDSVRV